VRIAIVGQVKSGKSSLINALLGERQARTDVLPATQTVTRHRWCPQGGSTDVVLLDTPGYGDAELTEQQLGELYQAFQQADVVLLTLKATHPARKPDVTLLKVMSQRFAAEPRYRPPAVVGVLTHIDGLSPVMEWSPPYDWSNPQRPKEHSLHEALVWNQQQFETALQTIIPVCLDETVAGGVYGVQEWLVPTLCTTLDDAHARALLRGLHDGIADRRLQELLMQCRTAAGQLLDAFIQSTSG
jgi:predicted GTPase